jgi:hypothetical protein
VVSGVTVIPGSALIEFGSADRTVVVVNNPAIIINKAMLKIIRKATGNLLFIPFLSP